MSVNYIDPSSVWIGRDGIHAVNMEMLRNQTAKEQDRNDEEMKRMII
jgi:hypothetical protein